MVTLSAADLSRQSREAVLSWALVVIPEMAQAIQERLSQGQSVEAILKGWASSVQETPEGKGLGSLLQAVAHLSQDQPEEALQACRRARQVWSEASPTSRLMESQVLTLLKRYDEAFAVCQEGRRDLLGPIFAAENSDSDPSLASAAQEEERDFYAGWVMVGIAQGLEGLQAANLQGFDAGGEKIIAVLKVAQEAGQEDVVGEVMDKVEQALSPEQCPLMEELRLYVRLGLIEDPFEGWRVLGEEISKVWPTGVSAIDAIQEQRK